MRVRSVMAFILFVSLFFIGLNGLLVNVIGITWLLALDVLLWTLMQLGINRACQKHTSTLEK